MFIKDMSCISPQLTFDNSFFEKKVLEFQDERIRCIEPSYKGLIPSNLLRRMSYLVRISVGAGLPLIGKNSEIGGIIFGSSNSGKANSMKFLNQIVKFNEGTLTPTDFVQSTSNSIAGSLALMGKITGYNTTHVNQGLSFESAILDALLQFEDGIKYNFLLGGGEENSESNYNIDIKRGLYKDESVNTSELLKSNTKGSLPGEGVSMFVVEPELSDSSIAEIVDVDLLTGVSELEVASQLESFLKRNKLCSEDIDTVFFGRNGDNRTDYYYDHLQSTFFSHSSIYTYKSLVGDYNTASAFGTWLAAKLLSGEKLPEDCHWQSKSKVAKNVLLYNHSEGIQHGFILMKGI